LAKFFWQLLVFIPKSTGAHTDRAEAMAPVIQTEDAESLNQPFGSGEAKRDSKF
jgi:hypothetical protein